MTFDLLLKTLTLPGQTYTIPSGALPDFVSILVIYKFFYLPSIKFDLENEREGKNFLVYK